MPIINAGKPYKVQGIGFTPLVMQQELSSVTSTTSSISADAEVADAPGLVLVLYDFARNTAADLPALVLPANFTLLRTEAWVDTSGFGCRLTLSYVLTTDNPIGSSGRVLTGQSGTSMMRKHLRTMANGDGSTPINKVVLDSTTFAQGTAATLSPSVAMTNVLPNCLVMGTSIAASGIPTALTANGTALTRSGSGGLTGGYLSLSTVLPTMSISTTRDSPGAFFAVMSAHLYCGVK